MTARALVTGGAGFIGSHLVERLVEDDWSVLVADDLSTGHLSNLAEARQEGSVHFHQLDITSPEFRAAAVQFAPDVIFHLAAQASVRASTADPVRDAMVNVIGTLEVLAVARQCETQRVVFASSGGAIYGEVEGKAAREDHPHRPASPYGISKHVVEDYFRYFQESAGIDYVLLALANVYGPRQDPHGEAGVVAIFSRALLDGRPPTINGDGHQTRDFVYVEDVADAFVRAAEAGGSCLLNIGTGVETSINDLFDRLAAICDFRGEPRQGPAQIGDLLRSVVDPAAAAVRIGWRPWTGLHEGLVRTVDHFRRG